MRFPIFVTSARGSAARSGLSGMAIVLSCASTASWGQIGTQTQQPQIGGIGQPATAIMAPTQGAGIIYSAAIPLQPPQNQPTPQQLPAPQAFPTASIPPQPIPATVELSSGTTQAFVTTQPLPSMQVVPGVVGDMQSIPAAPSIVPGTVVGIPAVPVQTVPAQAPPGASQEIQAPAAGNGSPSPFPQSGPVPAVVPPVSPSMVGVGAPSVAVPVIQPAAMVPSIGMPVVPNAPIMPAAVIQGVIQPVQPLLNAVPQNLPQTVNGAVSDIRGVVQPVVGLVPIGVQPTLNMVNGLVQPVLAPVRGLVNPVLGTVNGLVDPTLGTVHGLIDPALATVQGVVGNVVDMSAAMLPVTVDLSAARGQISNTVNGALSTATGAAPSISSADVTSVVNQSGAIAGESVALATSVPQMAVDPTASKDPEKPESNDAKAGTSQLDFDKLKIGAKQLDVTKVSSADQSMLQRLLGAGAKTSSAGL